MEKHEKLRAARRAKGLSQYQLAEIAKIDQSQISRMERGEKWAALETLKLIAPAVGLQLRELYDDPEAFSAGNESALPRSATEVAACAHLPSGLHEFATAPATKALQVTSGEWKALASIQLPVATDADGYTTLLLAIRSVTKS